MCIRDRAQVERDKSEDGSQDSGSVEDGAGQVPAPGGTDLHEARSITMWMFLQYIKDIWQDAIPWIYAVLIVVIVLLILGTAI